jgi:8-oxo-dGTP pyrophosphatase MutT (NUDIX family)
MANKKFRGLTQFAALPWRISDRGTRQVMLLTSRETHRWIIPKGWPMKKRKPAEVARQEAYEEAGLIGQIVGKRPVGNFHYAKRLAKKEVLCQVYVFSLRVERQLHDWPEKDQRETRWFDAEEAAEWWKKEVSRRLLTVFPVPVADLLYPVILNAVPVAKAAREHISPWITSAIALNPLLSRLCQPLAKHRAGRIDLIAPRQISEVSARRKAHRGKWCHQSLGSKVIADQRGRTHCNAQAVNRSLKRQVEVIER